MSNDIPDPEDLSIPSSVSTDSITGTVWVAWYSFDYESDHIIGVYSTQEKAETALANNVGAYADASGVMAVEIDNEPDSGGCIDWTDDQ